MTLSWFNSCYAQNTPMIYLETKYNPFIIHYAPFNSQNLIWTFPKSTCALCLRPRAIDRLNRAQRAEQ